MQRTVATGVPPEDGRFVSIRQVSWMTKPMRIEAVLVATAGACGIRISNAKTTAMGAKWR